ncbi:MAG: hypothetical protein ACOCP8_04055 [archaeon]
MISNILIIIAHILYILFSLILTGSIGWLIIDNISYRSRCTGDIGNGIIKLASIIMMAVFSFSLLIFLYSHFKTIAFILVILGLVITFWFILSANKKK